MKYLTEIWDYLSTTKGQRNVLIVTLVLAIALFKGCGDSSINTFKNEQNIEALQDSIRTYETKNGELVAEKMAFIVDKKELAKYSKELEEEVQKLKDNPIVVTKYVTRIKHDTTEIEVKADVDNITWNSDSTEKIVPFPWNADSIYDKNNHRLLNGKFNAVVDNKLGVKITDFLITQDETKMTFTTGITESKDDKVKIFITSDFPGFEAMDIEGALFDPTESDIIKKFFPPKKWSVGVYGGYGFYFDPTNARAGTGVNVGIAVHYSILRWNFKK